MIPSSAPPQLEGLTQVEEMLIARALPIMRVYIKPGGQRGYSGHCINLPQNVAELAHSLGRVENTESGIRKPESDPEAETEPEPEPEPEPE